MEQHKWTIYGRGHVPTFVKNWLMDYGHNDFKIQSGEMEFTGTDNEFTQLIRELSRDERDYKIIGWDCHSDIAIVMVLDFDETGFHIFIHDQDHPDQRRKITPETAYKIYLGANWNPVVLSFEDFSKKLGLPDDILNGRKIVVGIRKTKFAQILNSQNETPWSKNLI